MFDVTCACIGMKDLGVVVASSPTTIEIASDWDRSRTIVATWSVEYCIQFLTVSHLADICSGQSSKTNAVYSLFGRQ